MNLRLNERVTSPSGIGATITSAPTFYRGSFFVRVEWDDGVVTWSQPQLLDPNPTDPGVEGDEDEDEATLLPDPGSGAE